MTRFDKCVAILAGFVLIGSFFLPEKPYNPNHHAFLLKGLGHAYLEAGQLDSSLKYFHESAMTALQGGAEWHNIAHVLKRQGYLNVPKHFYLKATGEARFKKVYLSFNSLGNIYAEQDSMGKAVFCWKTAMKIKPGNYMAPYNYAIYLVATGNSAEARRVLRPFYDKGFARPEIIRLMEIINRTRRDT